MVDCQLVTDSRRHYICSADTNILTVPRTNTRLRDRFFDDGSESMEQSSCYTETADVEFGQFKRLLKTFLFGEAAAH